VPTFFMGQARYGFLVLGFPVYGFTLGFVLQLSLVVPFGLVWRWPGTYVPSFFV